MPAVVFESAGAGPLEVLAPDGGPLVDLCDERQAPVPFSCRSASCGTCRIEILEGSDLIEPPRDDELDVLDAFGDDPRSTRLACQARLKKGPGTVRVRPAP